MTDKSGITVAIGIATAGRAKVLSEAVDHLGALHEIPNEILICPASDEDVEMDRLLASGLAIKIVKGMRGSSAQRNAILDASNSDVVAFLDDDYLPANDFITQIKKLFFEDSSVVVATGDVLEDGILSQGLTFEKAKNVLDISNPVINGEIIDTYNAYGCNMIIRLDVVTDKNIRFDEDLPLYGWLEDLDFSRRLAPYGKIVKCMAIRGVHLGTKRSGRSPGKQLGYSQIANPVYLIKKGTMSWPRAIKLMSKNVIANTVKSLRPEPWVDRRGRLKGNLLAFSDLIKGKIHPTKILSF